MHDPPSTAAATPHREVGLFQPVIDALRVQRGTAHALFVFDLGFAIDLNAAERHIRAETKQRRTIRRKHPAPHHFDYSPPPLQIVHASQSVQVAGFVTNRLCDVVVYDFGAVSITFRIELTRALGELIRLGYELYDNETLLAAARAIAAGLLETIRPAVSRPGLSAIAEDYVIYQLESDAPPEDLDALVAGHGQPIAQLLRAEVGMLSRQEIEDALSCQIAYGPRDRTLIDWNAAIIYDREADDIRAVLEYANVQLLESRYLDDRLDDDLDQAYATLARQGWRQMILRRTRDDLRRVTELQIDAAILYEGVHNALKLLGDQYLARVYRLAAQRLHLPSWQGSIRRKLEVLESISQRLADQQSNIRLEILEWIIIILIAVSILM